MKKKLSPAMKRVKKLADEIAEKHEVFFHRSAFEAAESTLHALYRRGLVEKHSYLTFRGQIPHEVCWWKGLRHEDEIPRGVI